MKTIPQVRTDLKQIADDLRANGNRSASTKIYGLIKSMYRRPSIRRAKQDSRPYTMKLELDIIAYAKANPTLSYRSIANKFNVTTGRVSEALVGKREAA